MKIALSKINSAGIWARRLIYATLGGLDSVFAGKPKVSVFAYHSIGEDSWKFSVPLDEFKRQIDFLTAHFQPMRLSDLKPFVSGQKEISKPSFILTFDDGYKSLLLVKDYLKEKGICPTVFLLSKPNEVLREEIDSSHELLGPADVQELLAAGWEIGSHGAKHRDYRKLSGEELLEEVDESKRLLEKKFGIPVRYFSYPKGVHPEAVVDRVKGSGYELGLGMDDYMIDRRVDLFRVPRVGVDASHKMFEFKALAGKSAVMFRNAIKQHV